MALRAWKIKDSYLALVKEFPLRKIGSAEEHRQALAVVSRFAGREKIDEGVMEYFAVLSDLIVEYESRAGYVMDKSKVTAAEVIRHLMAENDLTISGFAREIG